MTPESLPSRAFNGRVALAVLVTVVTWASAFAGIRAGLRSYAPENLALLRYLTASVILAGYALVTRMPLPARRDWPALIGLGLAGFTIYNVALNLGETSLPAGTASLIIASAPIFVALMAGLFYRERLPGLGWLGIGLSVAGVAVISVDFKAGLTLTPSALLVLAAALAQAIYTVSQKPLLRRYSPIQLTSYAIWAGTACLLVFAPRLWADAAHAAPAASLAVVYMGVFPGAIGYVSWSYVLSHLQVSRAGSFLYLVPAVAIVIAWFWLGEAPAFTALLGGVLVVAGVMLVNLLRQRASAPA